MHHTVPEIEKRLREQERRLRELEAEVARRDRQHEEKRHHGQ